jgi:hypothetical protein
LDGPSEDGVAPSRLPCFVALARLVREHLDGIWAWTRLRISNGVLERV